MTHFGYLVAGYGVTIAAIGGYVWRVLARERRLARGLLLETSE